MRGAGYQGDIDLFADNPYPPYNPMLGTYFVSGAIPAEQCFPFGDAGFYRQKGVHTHLEQPVTDIDAAARSLTTDDGSRYSYERCLIASGASTAFPPIPGLDDPRVHGLRTFDDAIRLKDAVASALEGSASSGRPPKAVVLGASFAGIKVAAVLQEAGMQVLIVEREPFILPLAAHPECAVVMQEHLLEKGTRLRVGTTVCSVECTPGGLRVHLAGSDEAEAADLLVVCTGARPNLSFIREGQLSAEVGLIVNEHAATSVPTLYAAGDVAQGRNPLTGRHEIVGLWASARRQGRVAGLNMAGTHAESPGSVPCNITHVGDMMFATIGCMKEYDKLEIKRGAHELSAWAFEGGRLVGVNILNGEVRPGVVLNAMARETVTAAFRQVDSAADWLGTITWTR